MAQLPPTLSYESRGVKNPPHVSRCARVLLIVGIPVAIILLRLESIADHVSGGWPPTPIAPYTTGITSPTVFVALAFVLLSLICLYRIRRAARQLLGIQWAWASVLFWFAMVPLLLVAHALAQHERRELTIMWNLQGSGRCFLEMAEGGQPYPGRTVVPGSDCLLSGFVLPRPSSPPSDLVVLIQTTPSWNGLRWVAFADGSSRQISASDIPAIWAANNAARVRLGLAPLPPP